MPGNNTEFIYVGTQEEKNEIIMEALSLLSSSESLSELRESLKWIVAQMGGVVMTMSRVKEDTMSMMSFLKTSSLDDIESLVRVLRQRRDQESLDGFEVILDTHGNPIRATSESLSRAEDDVLSSIMSLSKKYQIDYKEEMLYSPEVTELDNLVSGFVSDPLAARYLGGRSIIKKNSRIISEEVKRETREYETIESALSSQINRLAMSLKTRLLEAENLKLTMNKLDRLLKAYKLAIFFFTVTCRGKRTWVTSFLKQEKMDPITKEAEKIIVVSAG